MKELFPIINKWLADNKRIAIATVIKTWGASPRPVGSNMIISEDKDMAGSVSGGCVEGEVIKAAQKVIEQNQGQLLSFGISHEEAWEVGLSCGGQMEVYLEPFQNFIQSKSWKSLSNYNEDENGLVLIQSIDQGETEVKVLDPTIELNPDNLFRAAISAYQERKSQVIELNEQRYFIQVFPPKHRLLIIGAAHITADLIQLAKHYHFETIVIDPRGIFTNKTHFPVQPNQLIEKYPEEVLDQFNLDAFTYAVILSHDPKIDDNALHVLLKSDIGYIGALGSRKTHAKRISRLNAAGFSESDIAMIHAPIGVDIKAKSPAEIALSIMGELIKIKNEYL